MAKYIQPISGLAVTKAKAASLPNPSASTDGVNIVPWAPRAGAGYPLGYITIDADGNCTLSNAALWAFDPVTGLWGFIASLNNGSSITLSTTQAYFQQFDLATAFTRLALVGSPSASNVGYTVVPIAEMY